MKQAQVASDLNTSVTVLICVLLSCMSPEKLSALNLLLFSIHDGGGEDKGCRQGICEHALCLSA